MSGVLYQVLAHSMQYAGHVIIVCGGMRVCCMRYAGVRLDRLRYCTVVLVLSTQSHGSLLKIRGQGVSKRQRAELSHVSNVSTTFI